MKTKIILLTMLLVPVCLWAQVEETNSIRNVRKMADETMVRLMVRPDTIYATTDGRMCLGDGAFILIKGLSNAQAGQIVTGQLMGVKTTTGGYPLFQIDIQNSEFQLTGERNDYNILDIDWYENLMREQEKPHNDDDSLLRDDFEGIPTAMSIKDFRKFENGTEARLELHYDTVMFVGGEDIYLRGNTAICLRGSGFNLERGMVLLGTIIGIRDSQDDMPLMLPSSHTSDNFFVVRETLDYIKDHVYTFDELEFKQNMGDMVTVEDVTVDSLDDGNACRALYAVKGSRRIPIVNRYNVRQNRLSVPASCNSLRGILGTNSESICLIPISDLSVDLIPLSIQSVNNEQNKKTSLVFDLQGRAVKGTPKHGVYVKDGRKVMK